MSGGGLRIVNSLTSARRSHSVNCQVYNPPNFIRVFPRHTSYTPEDSMAFVGDPPLDRPQADEVRVSVCFTWDKAEGERLAKAWGCYYPVVKLGGPAFNDPAEDFIPGLFVKPGVGFTSRGCEHCCPWCLVPLREGRLRLLPITPCHIIQDNSFLQTPKAHQEAVFAMLRSQNRAAEFTGGLEAALVDEAIAGQFRNMRLKQIFLAADTVGALHPLERAVKLLALPRRKIRCYVLLGYNGETLRQAEERLLDVWRAGALPFAQLYQSPITSFRKWPDEWRALARTWSRPAAMFSLMANEG